MSQLLPNYLSAKTTVTVVERSESGDRIRISAPTLDRSQDRVMPMGMRIESYLRNPVVQWGHQYCEPWQTIGRALSLSVTGDGVDAEFELREAASDSDPQHIVLYLWKNGFINAASVGFQPLAAEPNDFGGLDYTASELLEFSLVPIPANRESLRLAAKAFPLAAKEFGLEVKAGRVLSKENEALVREAYESLGKVLSRMASDEEEKAPAVETLSLDGIHTALLALKAAATRGV